MKSTLLMALTTLLLLTQCRKPSVNLPVAEDENTGNMTVTVGLGRTIITPNGEGAAVTWSTGDKLYVADEKGYCGFLNLSDGAGTATGTFTGKVKSHYESGYIGFNFFYLGTGTFTAPEDGDTEVDIDFSSQTGELGDLSKCHVGYGMAIGFVDGYYVTLEDIVTMESEVAIAYFKFMDGSVNYPGALTLSGEHIYNAMTVDLKIGLCKGKTVGPISLTGTASAQKYVMLIPTGTSEETLNFSGGATGSTTLYSGIEANKLYRMANGNPIQVAVFVPQSVDLGLSVEWATCNLGAESPEGYGDYYAWGETLPYYANRYSQESPCTHWRSMTTGAGNTTISNGYKWLTYSQGGTSTFTEWTNKPYGSNNILTSDHDAATANWGGSWRMPTEAEFNELLNNDNTTREWTDNYNGTGVKGYVVTSKVAGHAGNSIFLPAAGLRNGTNLLNAGSFGNYWSSSLDTSNTGRGLRLNFNSTDFTMNELYRYGGLSVRPVRASQN